MTTVHQQQQQQHATNGNNNMHTVDAAMQILQQQSGSNNTAELPQYVTLDATSSTCLKIYFALCAFMYWSDSWKTRNLMTCVTSFFRKLSRPTAVNKLTSRNKLIKNSEMRFVRCEIHGLFL